MKRSIIIGFFFLLAIYGICALLVLFNLYDWDVFFKIIAIVGGLASILGFGAAAFTNKDLLSYESQAIKRLAEAAEEIENKEHRIKETTDEIASLEYKKEELEVLVRKASLSLYYEEELERQYQKLLNIIHKNEDLNEVILSINQTKNNLLDLNSQIDENKEIMDILDTILEAKKKEKKKSPMEIVLDSFLGRFGF